MVIFYKKLKKNNKIQLAKNRMDLNNRKMKYHQPSPKKKTEEGKKRGVSKERSKAGTKNKVPTAYHYLIKIQY